MRDVVAALVGGGVIYVAMAACSAGRGDRAQGGTAGRAGGDVGSSSGDVGSSSGDDGPLDGMTDPVPSAAADPVSGSRLKARFITADDGSKAYTPDVWFDSERGENCQFIKAADGQLRCLPTEHRASAGSYYSDEACTRPLVVSAYQCEARYGISFDATCDNDVRMRVFALGQRISPAVIYIETADACRESTPNPSLAYYEVTGEIDPAAFVAGRVAADP
ncbi:hypothetical protein WMF45_00235 [Sorangium sp. So ce448]|uniref:DUF7481 family protein n=1 Tax=Sorangium sp. So ce448 TaxID=3133314 RepID=UPI003F6100DE